MRVSKKYAIVFLIIVGVFALGYFIEDSKRSRHTIVGNEGSGIVYPIPSLTSGFAFLDPRLLYWYPQKLREDRVFTFNELRGFFSSHRSTFRLVRQVKFGRSFVFVGKSFPVGQQGNECLSQRVFITLNPSSETEKYVERFLDLSNSWGSGIENIGIDGSIEVCVGDTERSSRIRGRQERQFQNHLRLLVPDSPRGYG